MSFIHSMLKDTIATILSPTRDVYGDKSYTAVATGVKCRFVDTPQYMYSDVGVVEVSRAVAWLKPTETNVDEGYKVRIDSSEYEIVSVEPKYGLGGNIKYKRMLLR